jgi:hypothetical protein
MSHHQTASSHTMTATGRRPTRRRVLARWAASFLGYPAGGALAIVAVGGVDSLPTALVGGAITGVVLGAVQAWALRADRTLARDWVVASGVGVMVGLGAGASVVGFDTDLRDLVLQGAITGAVLGSAQAVVLMRRVGRIALAWPAFLAGVWALGWTVTTVSGVSVDDQFTVFGSLGALAATALTAVLPLVVRRPRA